MSFHYSQGLHTRQAHKGIPEGYYEEEQGLKGFFGPVSHLIKQKPSTSWVEIDGPLRPHMFDLMKLNSSSITDSNKGTEKNWEQRLLFNQHLTLSLAFVPLTTPGSLRGYRNANGDLLFFCHKGRGEVLTEYGLIEYRSGQYIVIPKCLTYSFAALEPSTFLVIENCTSHYEEPERGLVGRHAIYDPSALMLPHLEVQQSRLSSHWGPVKEIVIRRGQDTTQFSYPSCVLADVIGWKGDLYPFGLHMDHMMPLMSHRAHLPPSAHTTFVARDFVVCTFLPRPLEKDADALKVPFYHQNIDYDEVLFYHAGDFFSRDNLHPGMMSLHPAGFPHGPHPKAIKSVESKTETHEYAVMIDSRWPLEIDPKAEQVELKDYWKSWRELPSSQNR